MNLYLFRTPWWLKWFYSTYVWKVNTERRELFLTFDDGPDPRCTVYVLNCLRQFNAKATFFCQGNQMDRYPGLVKEILNQGHQVGNHTYSHPSGWNKTTNDYLSDIQKWNAVADHFSISSQLFRPPYGRLRPDQRRILIENGYKIIMWTLLSGDFDKNLHVKASLKSLFNAEPGAIFLFHDSFAASQNLRQILPAVLKFYKNAGFTFKSLTEDAVS